MPSSSSVASASCRSSHRTADQRADDVEAVDLLGQRQAGDAPGEVRAELGHRAGAVDEARDHGDEGDAPLRDARHDLAGAEDGADVDDHERRLPDMIEVRDRAPGESGDDGLGGERPQGVARPGGVGRRVGSDLLAYVVVDRGARAIDRGQRHQDVHRLESIDQRAGVAGRELVVDVLHRLGHSQVAAGQKSVERRLRVGQEGRVGNRHVGQQLQERGAAHAWRDRGQRFDALPAHEPQRMVAADGELHEDRQSLARQCGGLAHEGLDFGQRFRAQAGRGTGHDDAQHRDGIRCAVLAGIDGGVERADGDAAAGDEPRDRRVDRASRAATAHRRPRRLSWHRAPRPSPAWRWRSPSSMRGYPGWW